jgi:hypothetical protein
MTNLLKNLFLLFLLYSCSLFAQVNDTNLQFYSIGFDFQEGVYSSIEEFRKNAPKYRRKIEKVDAELYIESDTSTEMILVDPERVWGFCLADNIYISYDNAYWRMITVGSLCHFTAIVVSSFQTVDAYGFPITQYSKSLQHLFLDVNSGEVYALTEEQLLPFMEEEPILEHRFQRIKRKKMANLIQALKDYNEFFPIEFPVYE